MRMHIYYTPGKLGMVPSALHHTQDAGKYYTTYPSSQSSPVTLCDSLVSLRLMQINTMMKTARMMRRITMTTATTTPIMTAEVEGSVGGVGERHSDGTRLIATCNAISNHTHTSYIHTYCTPQHIIE